VAKALKHRHFPRTPTRAPPSTPPRRPPRTPASMRPAGRTPPIRAGVAAVKGAPASTPAFDQPPVVPASSSSSRWSRKSVVLFLSPRARRYAMRSAASSCAPPASPARGFRRSPEPPATPQARLSQLLTCRVGQASSSNRPRGRHGGRGEDSNPRALLIEGARRIDERKQKPPPPV
jgi:hypothetical protein